MASPTFAGADVAQEHSQPTSPRTQSSNQPPFSASHPPTPSTHQGQPSAFPFYPPTVQDHSQDGQPMTGEDGQHHPQHPHGHPTPAEMLAAHTAQMQHAFHPGAVAFPPGTVPVAYFAGPHGGIIAIPQIKHKRRQVKNACTNCQKACKKCDEERPCSRCVKYGIDKDCVDSQRKERKKGIKRGPYKKRDPKAQQEAEEAAAGLLTPESAAFQAMAAAGGVAIYPYGPNGAPIMAQGIKGPDGTYTYPPQYYIPPPNLGQHPDASGSGEAGSSSQAAHGQYPGAVQYYNQMVGPYQAFPPPPSAAGYIIPPGGGPGTGQMPSDGQGGPNPGNPMYTLSPAIATNNDDPIERQKSTYSQPPPLPESSSTGGVVNVGSVDDDSSMVGQKSPKGKGKGNASSNLMTGAGSPTSGTKKGGKKNVDDKPNTVTGMVSMTNDQSSSSDRASGLTSTK
ncbi:hypothetical protein FRC03_008554 [Tulasnella sp. 419]|nr:hypothetical protein FRC02_010629 [Tulasnella sp. 418]KAG8958989.1 hypothetical protein FRC03_008554 [Tulasnella sp. 419]